jgi:chorismate mutase-like protein
MSTRVSDWRAAIDVLDGQLLTLLNTRAKLATELGKVKHEAGIGIVDPDRESQVLTRLRQTNKGPLDEGAVTRIFESIIAEARRMQAAAE